MALRGRVRLGDDIEFDVAAGRLYRRQRLLRVERVPIAVLELLVDRCGDVVMRQDIVDRVWGREVSFDSDNSLNVAIRKIRHVLRDSADHPRFIETIPGRGYRFIGTAVETPPQLPTPNHERAAQQVASVELISSAQELPPDAPPLPLAGRRRAWAVSLAVVSVAVAVFASLAIRDSRNHEWVPAAPEVGPTMLAVLPFEDRTPNPSEEYFTEGLTEELIYRLAMVNPKQLGVIARSSVRRYKGTRQPLDQIARELGVRYLVVNTLERSGEQIRVSSRLLRASDQFQVWSGEYDCEKHSLLAIQLEIARTVADEIHVALTQPRGDGMRDAPPAATAYAAHDAYLRALYFWDQRTPMAFHEAVADLDRAITAQPQFARAHALLAMTYALMGTYLVRPAAEVTPRAREAARRALEIDENVAEAHTALGLIALFFDRDWKAAEAHYRRAIRINANYPTAHHWLSELLGFQGRFDEALHESNVAARLDPHSLVIASDRAILLYYARRYDEAIKALEAIETADPNFPRAHVIVYPYVEVGRFEDALARVQRWRTLDKSPWTWANEAYILGRWGQLSRARQVLAEIEKVNQIRKMDPAPLMALAYAGVGDREQLIQWLQRGVESRSPSVIMAVKVDPAFDPYREDPRFQELLRRSGLGD